MRRTDSVLNRGTPNKSSEDVAMSFAALRIRTLSILLLAAAAASSLTLAAIAQGQRSVSSSLLLLIDASGSMGDEIGSGNSQVKIEAAKQAAIAALGRAAKSGSVEVAVLAFSGDCQNPVPRYQDFTRDVNQLTQFISSLRPGGGTPMADAVLFANRYMDKNGDSGATTRMIMLLADGQNDCGDIGQAMASLESGGIVFRHETVGFGITPSSQAAQDLRGIATQTGGVYHHAVDANQLADVFMEFVDTFTLIDMLGMFGKSSSPPTGSASSGAGPSNGSGNPKAGPGTSADKGGLTGMIGGFKALPPEAAETEKAPEPAPWGALAIDSKQGSVWGWAIDYPTVQEAERRALSECGDECHVVMRFSGECAAFAADQEEGSTVHGWANGYDSIAGAQNRALEECRGKGGASCIVRVWGCTRR